MTADRPASPDRPDPKRAPSPARNLLHVLLRAAVVWGAAMLLGTLLTLTTGRDGGANIGAGLLSFAVILVASLVWSVIDGRRHSRGWVLGVWAAVAVLVAIGVVLQIQGPGSGVDLTVLVSDLLSTGPFILGLVLVPALVGALTASGRRRA